MELSIVLIAVVFLLPFALGFTLLGAMAVDSGWASRPAITPEKPTRAADATARDRGSDELGHCVPA